MEQHGKIQKTTFAPALIPSRTRSMQTAQTIDGAVADAPVGATVTIPVNGRTSITQSGGGWRCQIFDLANRYVTIHLPNEKIKGAVQENIFAYPETIPVFLTITLTKRTANETEAIAPGIKTESAARARRLPSLNLLHLL